MSAATTQAVRSRSSREPVSAGATRDHVTATPAGYAVGARVTRGQILPALAQDPVGAASPEQAIVARSAEEAVVP